MRILVYIFPILNTPVKQSDEIKINNNYLICGNCKVPLPELFYNEIKNALSYDFILIDKCINIYATISPENLAPEILINLYYKVKSVINQTKHYLSNGSIVVKSDNKDFPDTFYSINCENTEYKILVGLRKYSPLQFYSKFKEHKIPFHNKKIVSPLNVYTNSERIIDRNKKECFICTNKSHIIILSACCCEIYYCRECWCENVRNSNCIMCNKKINELNAITFVNDEYCLPVSLYTTKIKAAVSHEINIKSENPSLTNWIRFFGGSRVEIASSSQTPAASLLCVNLSDILVET